MSMANQTKANLLLFPYGSKHKERVVYPHHENFLHRIFIDKCEIESHPSFPHCQMVTMGACCLLLSMTALWGV